MKKKPSKRKPRPRPKRRAKPRPRRQKPGKRPRIARKQAPKKPRRKKQPPQKPKRPKLTKKQRRRIWKAKLKEQYERMERKMGLDTSMSRRPPPVPESPERSEELGLKPIDLEVKRTVREFKQRIRKVDPQGFGPDLLTMFNRDGIDFVRKQADGSLKPVTWPRMATHKLMPTLLAKDVADKDKTHFDGYAHAVCLVPMKRPDNRRVDLEIKCPLSKYSFNWPPFKTEWPVRQQRKAVLEYAYECGVYRRMKPTIMKMDAKRLKELVDKFIKASRWLREKRRNDPETKAYWAERKAALEAKKKAEQAALSKLPKSIRRHKFTQKIRL